MKNLFIVNTPFHLLESFILSQTIYQRDENYLALVRPHGYDRWHEEELMKYLASVEAGYCDVFVLNDWLSSKTLNRAEIRKQVNDVRTRIGKIGIDEVFLSCDAILFNQLFVATLGLENFWRMDDGIYSYYTEKRRSTAHRIFHQLKAQYLKMAWQIHSDLPINTGANAENPAGKGDILYLPELLLRPSPKVCEITAENITVAMSQLRDANRYELRYCEKNKEYAMYLSQGLLQVEKEVAILKRLQALMPNTVLIYKPHPNDLADKIRYIGANFVDVELCDSKIPVEIMLYFEQQIKTVIGYQSTPLILAKKFTGRDIECISIANLYPQRPILPVYLDMMSKKEVRFIEK